MAGFSIVSCSLALIVSVVLINLSLFLIWPLDLPLKIDCEYA